MLDTVYLEIRHMNFWYGIYGFSDKSCNDEIIIYKDANKTNKLGYFEIITKESLVYLKNYELNEPENYDYKKEIEMFLDGNSEVYFSYIYPRDEEDLIYQVSHFAPLNINNHKPIYIHMWTKLSVALNVDEIKKCAEILIREFLHEDVSNIEIVDIPTFEETKKAYYNDF